MWFKVMSWQKSMIDSVSDADAGAGLKGVLRHLTGDPVGELSADAMKVYQAFKPRVMIALDIERCRKERDNAYNP